MDAKSELQSTCTCSEHRQQDRPRFFWSDYTPSVLQLRFMSDIFPIRQSKRQARKQHQGLCSDFPNRWLRLMVALMQMWEVFPTLIPFCPSSSATCSLTWSQWRANPTAACSSLEQDAATRSMNHLDKLPTQRGKVVSKQPVPHPVFSSCKYSSAQWF